MIPRWASQPPSLLGGGGEAGAGDQLDAADAPVLARLVGRAVQVTQAHAEHFAEEADVPVDVAHAQGDVFDVGAGGSGVVWVAHDREVSVEVRVRCP